MGTIWSKKKELILSEQVDFDHFKVLRAIGRGSFGKVCIVEKRSSKCLYAMKYVNKTECMAKGAVHSILREILILSSLQHPFLVNLWFSFQDEEDIFMVVDLLLGGDLRYHLQHGVIFSDDSTRLILLEAASALEYLHNHLIIHRDVKPENLLLDEKGHVHLTDFNMATVLKDPSDTATSMSGTKPYMAPEMFECALNGRNAEGYSCAVDWWSLGVTAFELRTGERPFHIHSTTPLSDIPYVFLSSPKYPSNCVNGLNCLLKKLLTVSSRSRANSLAALQVVPYAAEITVQQIIQREIEPPFTPPKDHLNCDPTFELEEMIIESKPLHKKRKRLLKQRSTSQNEHSSIFENLIVFNREEEELKKEKEMRERIWEEELNRSMNLPDTTGEERTFTSSISAIRQV